MEYCSIGYFSKVHGVKGQLILKLEADVNEEALTVLFMDASGGKAPYFISEFKDHNQGIIVALEEVDSIEIAKKLLNKTLYVDSNLILESEPEEDWTGFELIDKIKGSLGKIEGMSSNGEQDVVHLQVGGREVLLPLVDEFVEEIDEQHKTIKYNAPEGLVDVYLEGLDNGHKQG